MEREGNINPNPNAGLGDSTGGFQDPGTGHGGVRERASEAVDRGKDRVASGAEKLGERLHERATEMEHKGGVVGRAAGPVHRAGETIEEAGEYVRTHDMADMRSDLANQIRAHPLRSVGIALGAGFIIGRILD